MEVTLGGDRLGSGKRQKIELKNYERSTHDLSYIWRSTMSAGTLVPFMVEVGLPGDTFDIDLECEIMTMPTIGPLFGSYKVQLDLFKVDMRLFQGRMHMNKLNTGLKINSIKFPLVELSAEQASGEDIDNSQINPSSIFKYLGISGLGAKNEEDPMEQFIRRRFNAIPWLGYWSIYKNYYANKQEEIGMVIHNDLQINEYTEPEARIKWTPTGSGSQYITGLTESTNAPTTAELIQLEGSILEITFTTLTELNKDSIYIWRQTLGTGGTSGFVRATEIYTFAEIDYTAKKITFSGYVSNNQTQNYLGENVGTFYIDNTPNSMYNTQPRLEQFKLELIDDTEMAILGHLAEATPYVVDELNAQAPYAYAMRYRITEDARLYSKLSSQEGLGVKTYQSDLFNNWISTEWLDGDNGVNAISAVNIVDDKFTIDALNLQKKVYDMLNRIALAGNSYDDWLDATYNHERRRGIEAPIYIGGLSKELVFQEVINQTSSEANPLGQIAGKGVLTNKHKGGSVIARIDEPCYIMGIVSLTPRIDYGQGNMWHVNLKTLDDLHKPGLDEIGFQDLICEQMAWWSTNADVNNNLTFQSAGKQPAWINYMTNVNKIYGNFCIKDNQMYMTLNRRYESVEHNGSTVIKDLTTYIDPTKFNHIFAQTSLDAQNFWVQIGVKNTARRKMSAKVIPNL